jgi:hypothetical protein
MTTHLVEPKFLFRYASSSKYCDYRSVVNGSGSSIVFERAPAATPLLTQLYRVDLKHQHHPKQFLTTLPEMSGRPDWSWKTHQISFTGAQTAPPWTGEDLQIALAPGRGGSFQWLSGTDGMEYSTWFPSAKKLAVMTTNGTLPSPNTSEINLQGTTTKSAITGKRLWAGMPTVNKAQPHLIAFAGQVVQQGGKYDEDNNYIWLLDTRSKTVKPLEPGCPRKGKFERRFQGRAPWWSPCGTWLVFESVRASKVSADLYSIFLIKYGESTPIRITHPKYNMNHAKWFPNGFPGHRPGPPMLSVASWRPPKKGQPPAAPYQLATLDVSSIVGPTLKARKRH